MLVTIYTAINKLFDKVDAKAVYLPAIKGDMQILDNHIPVITSLKEGYIVIDQANGKELRVQVNEGYAQFADNAMTVVIEQTQLDADKLKRMEAKAVMARDNIIKDDEDITEEDILKFKNTSIV